MSVKKVAVIMGSDSDFPVVTPAIKRLKEFGIPVEVRVMSAHRTPDAAASFSANAVKDGFGVIIAAAGKAAHLAGVLAAHTTLPVIGIPVKSSTLDGLDALLATVQMPSGIPVATVAIDGADNAVILAALMKKRANAKCLAVGLIAGPVIGYITLQVPTLAAVPAGGTFFSFSGTLLVGLLGSLILKPKPQLTAGEAVEAAE